MEDDEKPQFGIVAIVSLCPWLSNILFNVCSSTSLFSTTCSYFLTGFSICTCSHFAIVWMQTSFPHFLHARPHRPADEPLPRSVWKLQPPFLGGPRLTPSSHTAQQMAGGQIHHCLWGVSRPSPILAPQGVSVPAPVPGIVGMSAVAPPKRCSCRCYSFAG